MFKFEKVYQDLRNEASFKWARWPIKPDFLGRRWSLDEVGEWHFNSLRDDIFGNNEWFFVEKVCKWGWELFIGVKDKMF